MVHKRNIKDITHLVIHHSATSRSQDLDKCIASFDRTHKEGLHKEAGKLGYHIAYSYVLGSTGESILTRFPDEIGCHAGDWAMNCKSIGICLVGNFDKEYPSVGQIIELQRIINAYVKEYGIRKENIIFHRDVINYKTCPGKNFTHDILKGILIPIFTPMENISLKGYNSKHENQNDRYETQKLCQTYAILNSAENFFKRSKGYRIDFDELQIQNDANTWYDRLFSRDRPLQIGRLYKTYNKIPFPYKNRNLFFARYKLYHKPKPELCKKVLHECLGKGIVPVVGVGGNSKYSHINGETVYKYSKKYYTSFHAVTVDTYKDGEFSGQNSTMHERHRITDVRCISSLHVPVFGEEIIEIYKDCVRWKSMYKDHFVTYRLKSLIFRLDPFPIRRARKLGLVTKKFNRNFKK